jgi:hypothetical protein
MYQSPEALALLQKIWNVFFRSQPRKCNNFEDFPFFAPMNRKIRSIAASNRRHPLVEMTLILGGPELEAQPILPRVTCCRPPFCPTVSHVTSIEEYSVMLLVVHTSVLIPREQKANISGNFQQFNKVSCECFNFQSK